MKKKSVLVGMSGGIDSTVAAVLLQEQKFHVEGLYIKNGFPTRSESKARLVAERLNIPLHVLDTAHQFKKDIIDYFIAEYAAGRTPNPCIICNKKIKFRYLLEEAEKRQIDYCATGHYARIETTGAENIPTLLRGIDRNKDQSYFLFQLGQKELERIIFPNGKKTKEEIRNIARKLGFESFFEKESQEICFIPDNDYRRFVENTLTSSSFKPGNIVDQNRSIVGKHRGIHSVTVGQRKGLNIASEKPYYVIEIDRKNNEVIVGRDEDQFFKGLIAENVSLILQARGASDSPRVQTQIRYRHRGVDSDITFIPGKEKTVFVRFDTPLKAVAPGQAAVFYQGDVVIGGGWISKGVRGD
jgi:tRNA-specific 2-thiouridylase